MLLIFMLFKQFRDTAREKWSSGSFQCYNGRLPKKRDFISFKMSFLFKDCLSGRWHLQWKRCLGQRHDVQEERNKRKKSWCYYGRATLWQMLMKMLGISYITNQFYTQIHFGLWELGKSLMINSQLSDKIFWT